MGHGNKFVDQPKMDPQLAGKGFKLGLVLAVIEPGHIRWLGCRIQRAVFSILG